MLSTLLVVCTTCLLES